MALTVYLSNTSIQVVEGTASTSRKKRSIHVRSVYTMELPEGSILNGVITDPETLTKALDDFWNENRLPDRNITLVVNSPQLMIRVLDIPQQSPKKMEQFLYRELSSEGRVQSPIVGYTIMDTDKEKKTARVMAQYADKDFFFTYDQVFRGAGIHLTDILSGIGVILQGVEYQFFRPEERLILILDDMTLTSILFIEGHYFYSSSARVFSDHGTPEFAREIAGVVSRLRQFLRTQKVEAALDQIELSGFSPEDTEGCRETIGALFGQEVSVQQIPRPADISIDVTTPFSELIFAVSGLCAPKANRSCLQTARLTDPVRLHRRQLIVKAVPYFVTLGLCVLISIVMVVANVLQGMKLDDLRSYNTNILNVQTAQQYDTLNGQLSVLETHQSGLKLLKKYIHSYPKCNQDVLDVVGQCASGLATITVEGFDSSSGILTVVATSDNVRNIHQCIAKLQSKAELFSKVDYTGYTMVLGDGTVVNGSGTLTEGTKTATGTLYMIKLSLGLSEYAGKTADEVKESKTENGLAEDADTSSITGSTLPEILQRGSTENAGE